MPLVTERLGSTDQEPLSLEVSSPLCSAAAVLLHLERLPGLRVIAKKSWVLTDDFEAYFLYRNRLFVMYTPLSELWVSLIGQPADEPVFAEVEAQLRSYRWYEAFLGPLAVAKYFFLPFNPPRKLIEQHS